MSEIVDAEGNVREVRRIIDNNQSGDGPKQMVNLRVDGNNLAIALALLAFGGIIVAAILIPEIIEARAKEAGSAAEARSVYAERESRIAIDQVQTMRIELAKQKIFIQLDDHQ